MATYIDTLAAAYAEIGNFAEAIKWAQTAEALAGKDNELRRQIVRRLEDYRRGKPWQENQ